MADNEATLSREDLLSAYQQVRDATEAFAADLSAEDQQLQSMASTSPTKWHRAHTTWFFETFILDAAGVAPFDERFRFLYNSYYEGVGAQPIRAERGLVSRPSAEEVTSYRAAVDAAMRKLIATLDSAAFERLSPLIQLGLAHEQQHQELLLTDILHAFAQSPIKPVYRARRDRAVPAPQARGFHTFEGGLVEIGAGPDGFAFDNERPRHRVFLEPFELAHTPATVGELRAFIQEGGYSTPSLWLSEGFAQVRNRKLTAPAYTELRDGTLRVFGLSGWEEPQEHEPARFLDFWEAEALARFLGGRLPTEMEWEHAASFADEHVGNFADGPLTPTASEATGLVQLFGDVWEWTRSAYAPYPGFESAAGAVGEYNGKFMAQQFVLRGGSCFTPRGHVRASYRNFWPPDTRFQMTGVRIARCPKRS
jgi:ergothioneine biosynthesis protein EgtB